ncbi:putative transcriptional regulator [Halobiforma nitratireducens JCM 10879]|uniref:Putative transcriptional regulator n=1 Tax=Halobiforma nitratireducens JCM 10879 TaxID=1227454 RepID=M0L6S8_9EURY|nr:putative transcriptional regulator [Halobiforma nitratireducens JCM 10879]
MDGSTGAQADGHDIGDRRNLLNVATQETRFEIIQNIVGHPEQLPSLKELDYFIPDTRKSTIRNHLDKLEDAGIVTPVKLPEEERSRDLPRVFYGLTRNGRDVLEEAGLLRAERSLQETTVQTKLTDEVVQYMNAPRPDWDPARPLEADQDK